MNIATHQLEPWLIRHRHAPYDLAQSGMADQTVGELLALVGQVPDGLARISLRDNDTFGSPELRQAIAGVYGGVDPGGIMVTTGTSEALWIYFAVRHEPGANVVVPFPAFQSLYEVPRYLGYEVRLLPLRAANGFRPDLDELRALVDRRTKAIVVNNPHNPTGTLFDDRELDEMTALAEAHDADILADEHYRFLPHDGPELLPSLYGRSPCVVAVGSMIKCFGCVGLRVGWMLGPGALLSDCRDFKDYTTHTLSGISDFIALAVLSRWRELARRYRGWVVANARALGDLTASHPDMLALVPPQAGIVTFPELLDPEIAGSRFCQALVEAQGVSAMPGEAFEMPRHFRVGLGLEPRAFAEAMRRMEAFIASRGWQEAAPAGRGAAR